MRKHSKPFAVVKRRMDLDYRKFLEQKIAKIMEQEKISYRGLAQRAGLKSPNYFQQVINGKRNLKVKTVEQISAALGFSRYEEKLFHHLVQYEAANDNAKHQIRDQINRIVALEREEKIKDDSIHSHWLYPVVYVMAQLKDFNMSIENIKRNLRAPATDEEIDRALQFLLRRKWLVPADSPDHYEAKEIKFLGKDDVRKVDVQKSHRIFLEIAKHRLNDDVEEREFQGKTLSISGKKFPLMKKIIRETVKKIDEEFGGAEEIDEVVRVQLCAFKLLKNE